MLPSATLIATVTFLLDLTAASPVYNMQPAFITTNIGSTSGRNIRNLPCVSRKNHALSGVCMFAIDCLKANGTHLGTCIDRFYFGSCCHIEPIKDHGIETNIILMDTREPPERRQNTTQKVSTTTSTSTSPVQIINKVSQTTITSSTAPSTETTTPPAKLQTFQMVNGDESAATPVTTKLPTMKPQPAITTPSRPVLSSSTGDLSASLPSSTNPSTTKTSSIPTTPSITKPSTIKSSTAKVSTTKPSTTTLSTTKLSTTKPSTTSSSTTKTSTTSKPSLRPPKPSQKPVKVVSTTTKTTTSKKPTRRGTRPTTVKTTTAKSPPPATTATTKKPDSTSATTSPTSTSSTATTSMVPPLSTTIETTGEPLMKKNTSQILESDVAMNEVLVESSSVAIGTTVESTTTSRVVAGVSSVSTDAATEASSSIELPTDAPMFPPGLVTWTVDDAKNHTVEGNVTVTGNITEEWVPITTPDGWVLLPSVSSSTAATTTATQNETAASVDSIISTTAAAPSKTSTLLSSEVTSMINVSSTPESTTIVQTGTAPIELNTSTEEATPKPVNISDFTDVCGRRMWPEARIVGGEKSAFGRWPWQISLRQWRTSTYLHKCGAALLNENWAITAAHCVDNVPPSDLLLRLGEHDLSTEGEPYLHEERRVQIVASHPQFDPRTFEYDLALLRFYEPVQFQPNVIPVCVPKSDENFVGRTAHVTGWGRLYEDGPLPSVLQEVSVPVINNTVCESMYRNAGYIEHIPHIFICAGWRKGGFDSCEGDSGGPMVIQREDRRFLLAGVISWGIGCAEPNQPGVYTRISEFRDWINQILQF